VLEGQYSGYKQVRKKSAGLQMFFTLFLCQRRVALIIKNAKKMGKKSSLHLLTLRLTVPNSPITYNLSNFITGCRSLGDKIIEVLL
jgi:hypothetical protein